MNAIRKDKNRGKERGTKALCRNECAHIIIWIRILHSK